MALPGLFDAFAMDPPLAAVRWNRHSGSFVDLDLSVCHESRDVVIVPVTSTHRGTPSMSGGNVTPGSVGSLKFSLMAYLPQSA